MGMVIPAMIAGVGSVVSGIGQANAADYQSQVAANNAKIATQNAQWASQEGDVQATNQGLKDRANLGRTKAAFAANGVDVNSGSAADVQGSERQLGMVDSLTIRNNAARQAYGYQSQSTSFQAQSQLDTLTGDNDIAASLLGGASSLSKGIAQQGMFGNTNGVSISF